jgi:hypothetical protein
MLSATEVPCLEAEIADCCQALYTATDVAVAMLKWTRLRTLTAQKAELGRAQYLSEVAGCPGIATG